MPSCSAAARLPVPCYPAWINSFISQVLDAFLLIEAYLSKRPFLFPCGPGYGRSSVANGFIFVYEHDADAEKPDERSYWTFVDLDGIFEVSQSTGSSGLMRKKASVWVDGIQICLESYYKPWDTVNGLLIPPTRCLHFQDVTLRHSLAMREDLQIWSPMEAFRSTIEALGQYQPHFKQLAACLIFSSTDDSQHYVFLRQDWQLFFPYLPSDEDYWWGLSKLPVFEGKTPSELQFQTIALLHKLLRVSGGFCQPPCFEPSQDFLPLQNLCLYFEAFRIKQRPLGALRPINERSLAWALQESRLFSDDTNLQPQMMEPLDRHLRRVLPIDCLRNEVYLTPAFVTLFTSMSVTDQEAVRMGIELLCQKFPRFRDLEFRHLLLLHQCYHSSTDEDFMTILQGWTHTGDGERTVRQVFQVFQTRLEPEVLALALADMLLLWTLDPPTQGSGSQSTTSDLWGLEQLLSERVALRNSYNLLLDLFASFCDAIKVLETKRWTAIVRFLSGAVCFTEHACPKEELTGMFLERLNAKSLDQSAQVTAAEMETLVGNFVLL